MSDEHKPNGRAGETPEGASFFPVSTDALDCDALELDLYLMHAGMKPVLFRGVGSSYSMSDCAKLAEKGITTLYVTTIQHRVFQKLVTERLVRAYDDPERSREERCRIVRESCGKMIDDMMRMPQVEGIAETLGGMAAQFSAWCTQDEDKFGHLLDMSEHDFYTTTHMVNVGVGCGMLCAELLGADAPLMQEIVQGGFVHDIGKRGVPAEILNKEGKLSDDEWKQIRAHPLAGVDILSSQKGIGRVAVEMTRDHHEKLDGRGYPNGARGDAIGLPARICAVVDVYDAIATARPYRGAVPPLKVLDMLRPEAGTTFDPAVFEAWERVIRRQIDNDPTRCVPDTGAPTTVALGEMLPSSEKEPPRRVRPAATTAVGSSALPSGACEEPVTIERAEGGPPATGVMTRCAVLEVELRTDAPTRPGERLMLALESGQRLEVVASKRSFGPTGETIVQCARVHDARRAA